MLIYHLFLFFYQTGIHLVSFWNRKARLWISGRKKVFERLKSHAQAISGKKIIWMHCASLGEFEQGRPVIDQIKNRYPDTAILITFFSPSGYEMIKNNKNYGPVSYLPMDSPRHARKWMDILKPDLVLWVKYEYWHYYLHEIRNRNIPLLMVSGIYRDNQVFFRWYGGFYRNILQCFTHFFVQNTASAENLQKIIPRDKITVSGDTRCDRVIDIAEQFTHIPGIQEFCGNDRVIVAGSTWEDDEAEWTHFVREHPEIRFIVAPHEIDAENLADIRKEFPGSIFYSEWLTCPVRGEVTPHCLIIDNIGILSRLYQYATLTYVGGGFGDDGLHNILEAAVFAKPVLFGPNYSKNFEAGELIEVKGAISIDNAIALETEVIRLLGNNEELLKRGTAAKNYVYKNAGATRKIISFLEKYQL